MKETLCENYDDFSCPIDCTFWDCDIFHPTYYFLTGIKELKNNYKKLLKNLDNRLVKKCESTFDKNLEIDYGKIAGYVYTNDLGTRIFRVRYDIEDMAFTLRSSDIGGHADRYRYISIIETII